MAVAITKTKPTAPEDKIPLYATDNNALLRVLVDAADLHAFLGMEGEPLSWIDEVIERHELLCQQDYWYVRCWVTRPDVPAVTCYLSEDIAVAISLLVDREKGDTLYEFIKQRKILDDWCVDIANIGACRNIHPFDPDGEVIIERVRDLISQRAMELVSEVAPSSGETVPAEKIPFQTKLGEWLYNGLQALMWRDLERRYPHIPENEDERSELAVYLAQWRPEISPVHPNQKSEQIGTA